MHEIASCLPGYSSWFTPYYDDGFLDWCRRRNLLEFSILGNKLRGRCLSYLTDHHLQVDVHGTREYDLVVTCADLVIPRNIRGIPLVLVQEGMTDPEGFIYNLVRTFPVLPRWLASTSAMGLSNAFTKLCVASDGYRELFMKKGVPAEKIVVTGIPNFDNCKKYLKNDFPHHNYVLVCTSDTRETFGYERRREMILHAVSLANGGQLIFKLHPNEKHERAIREIRALAPEALVYTDGKAEEMIANCHTLVTRYSSTAFVGLALGKIVYSAFDVDELRRLLPVQNASGAMNIAEVCRNLLGRSWEKPPATIPERKVVAA
jgi:hypothetical protein